MCARLRPMEVVSLLNAMYVAFDHLCEVNHVYKVTYSVSVIALCFLKHEIFCYISSYAQQLIIYCAIFVQPILHMLLLLLIVTIAINRYRQ